jgi:ribosomal-protein-alanine N-acetyltransferase
MTAQLEYTLNKASAVEIAAHLSSCDADFVPTLSSRVEICSYAEKIARNAIRIEAWAGSLLVGLVAAYCNDHKELTAYISSVSVLKTWGRKGIAAKLLMQCIDLAKANGMQQISLEVASENTAAIKLYERSGFVTSGLKAPFVCMICIF